MTEKTIGFEKTNGFKPFSLLDLRKLAQAYDVATPYRIYTLLLIATAARPSEMENITWFDFHEDNLIYRPGKQHGRCTRIIKIPPKIFDELMRYKEDNFFSKGRLFRFKFKTYQRDFNVRVRRLLGGIFLKRDIMPYSGAVMSKHYYSLRSIRVAISTLVYIYFRQIYGDNVALSRTCSWLGHRSEKMTSDHYIRHIGNVDVKAIPADLPLLNALDYLVYEDVQTTLRDFGDSQLSLHEYNKYVAGSR